MPRLAYISFDQVPAAKGASTHIEAFVRGLAGSFGTVDLLTVSATALVQGPCERWPGVNHWELPAIGATLIERVLYFRGFLLRFLETRQYDAIQFRSIFEGLPILKCAKGAALVFEVNGLPSIELKYRFPLAADDRELMRKLESQERRCVAAADRIVTPSAVTRDFLVSARGARRDRVAVIPNGADPELFHVPQKALGDGFQLLYFGTLSAWQGVEIAIRAIAMVEGTALTIVGTGSSAQRNAFARLATKLGVASRVAIKPAVSQVELARELANCDAVVAPLLWNDRNVVQGCSPLKVLEGMAAGKPVIASDLRVVRELGEHDEHFLLSAPGSVDSLVSSLRRLRNDRELAATLAANARLRVEERYLWTHAVSALVQLYRELLRNRDETASFGAASAMPKSQIVR